MRHDCDDILAAIGGLLFEVIAFVGRVQSVDILLFEDLEVVEHDDHAHFDLLLSVVEKQHEIDFDFLDGIGEGSSVLGFAFEGLFRFYAADYTEDVDDVEMLLLHYLVDSDEFAGLGREVDVMLQHDVGIFIECYLQLLLFGYILHLSSSEEVVVAYNQFLSCCFLLRHKVDTLHFCACFV